MKNKIVTINLEEKFNSFNDFWNPKIVGELNEQFVKVVKVKDEFVSHKHENEDELFLVIEGKLLMELEDETLEINSGEFVIIPKGTIHKPIGIGEVKVLLFEPKAILNTGNKTNKFTVNKLKKI